MRTKEIIICAAILMATFLLGLYIGRGRADPTPIMCEETKETSVDTKRYIAPNAVSELERGTSYYTVPVSRNTGAGSGGEPRQRTDLEGTIIQRQDSIGTRIYGTGAGGEPRLCGDSVMVELPVLQRHYADSTYEAWVSGPVDPRLDSLRVFAPRTVITKRERKPPKRWHIGVTAGYGYTRHGFEPYVGVGVTYSIISL